jgi:hypothetical protein
VASCKFVDRFIPVTTFSRLIKNPRNLSCAGF